MSKLFSQTNICLHQKFKTDERKFHQTVNRYIELMDGLKSEWRSDPPYNFMSYQCDQRGCVGGWDCEELCLVTRRSCERSHVSRVSREACVTRDRERAGTGSSGQSRGWSSHTQSQCVGVCSILHLVKLICDPEKYLMTHSCALLSSSSACGRGTRGKPGIRPA